MSDLINLYKTLSSNCSYGFWLEHLLLLLLKPKASRYAYIGLLFIVRWRVHNPAYS